MMRRMLLKLMTKLLQCRKLDPSAKELADKYFFETVVRLHRMGEGASYTGIKPAGYNNDPSVKAADRYGGRKSVKRFIYSSYRRDPQRTAQCI
jgi:hypothetical protein